MFMFMGIIMKQNSTLFGCEFFVWIWQFVFNWLKLIFVPPPYFPTLFLILSMGDFSTENRKGLIIFGNSLGF